MTGTSASTSRSDHWALNLRSFECGGSRLRSGSSGSADPCANFVDVPPLPTLANTGVPSGVTLAASGDMVVCLGAGTIYKFEVRARVAHAPRRGAVAQRLPVFPGRGHETCPPHARRRGQRVVAAVGQHLAVRAPAQRLHLFAQDGQRLRR